MIGMGSYIVGRSSGTAGQWNGSLLDLDFARNSYSRTGQLLTLADLTTFSRPGPADWLNSAGDGLSPQAGLNVLRRDGRGALIEGQSANVLRNSTAAGAVAGTPGTPPTNWSIAQSGSGISREIVGTGLENGIPYIDLRFFGTGSGGATVQIMPETTTQVVAAVGQAWTACYFLRVVGGSTTGVVAGSWQAVWQERDSGGTPLITDTPTISAPTTAALGTQRRAVTRTLTNAGTARLTNRVQFSCTDGAAVDITLRVGNPQLEQLGFATSPIQTSGAPVTRLADVLSAGVSIGAGADWTVAGVARMPSTPDNAAENLINLAIDASNRWAIRRSGAGALGAVAVVAGATQAGNPAVAYPAAGTVFGWALRRSGSALGLSINGGTISNATPAAMPSGAMATLGVGHRFDGSGQWNDFISRVLLFNTAANDATLQSYSTLATWGG